jgi:ATP synthase protein I
VILLKKNSDTPEKELVDKITSDVEKKIRSRKEGKEIMFGMGVFGIVGWSIAVPTLLGIALGLFLDERYSSEFSWTLTLIFVGVIAGCLNAWHWIKEKSKNE